MPSRVVSANRRAHSVAFSASNPSRSSADVSRSTRSAKGTRMIPAASGTKEDALAMPEDSKSPRWKCGASLRVHIAFSSFSIRANACSRAVLFAGFVLPGSSPARMNPCPAPSYVTGS